MRNAVCFGGVLAVLACPGLGAAEPLVRNGGFEEIRKPFPLSAVNPKFGPWVLETDGAGPGEWTLNPSFPGKLSVVSEEAPEGKRFLRVQAYPKRAAHIYQSCPSLRSGEVYTMSLSYRGGPVSIRTYEYDRKNRLVSDAVVVRGAATGEAGGAWQTVEQYYNPWGVSRISVVVSVAPGAAADVDDLRVRPFTPAVAPDERGRLKVTDYGVSGSRFETRGTMEAGSTRLVLAEAGDFRIGQGIGVEEAEVRHTDRFLWGPEGTYGTARPWGNAAHVRGFDGSAGPWTFYLLEIDGADPLTFRWKDDLSLEGYRGVGVAVTHDWQPLSQGVEIKLAEGFSWKPGHLLTFNARNTLLTSVARVEGKILTLAAPANRSIRDARVFHEDTQALQRVIDQAVFTNRNVFFPNGLYRLTNHLAIRNAADILLEGASAERTVLDISMGVDGLGHASGATPDAPCFLISGGKRVTVRNFRMVGHTGFADRAKNIRTVNGDFIWGFQLQPCRAVAIVGGTEHVLVENVHATRMASECFYSQTPGRGGDPERNERCTKEITYLRCSVEDCGFNAFNNNDTADSTSVLYCRIVDVGNCAWEGPSRYIRFIGNYIRNGGVCTIGNISTRVPWLTKLGCGQAIFADNVFEGSSALGYWINVCHGATQVVLRNNLFVNSGGTAIRVTGRSSSKPPRSYYPARNVLIDGNLIDLTAREESSRPRIGIDVSASDVTVCNNQIYVRDRIDPTLTGIRLREPAMNLNVHDNLIRNCGRGIHATRTSGRVGRVLDERSFLQDGGDLPLVWPGLHGYRGWTAVWTSETPPAQSRIEAFDARTCVYRLSRPRGVRTGDVFEVIAPAGINWRIRNNTITDCPAPVELDVYGGNSVLAGNLISRGQATEARNAIVVGGRFDVTGNRVGGFDEPGGTGLRINPDPLGRPCPNVIRDNVLERCSRGIAESRKGLLSTAMVADNVFLECAEETALDIGVSRSRVGAYPGGKAAVWQALRLDKDRLIDGDVGDWDWRKKGAATVPVEWSPEGLRLADPACSATAAWRGTDLFLAVRCAIPEGAATIPGINWGGDGVEVSFQGAGPRQQGPVFVLWGTTDGRFHGSTCGGASDEQVERLERETAFAVRVGRNEWTCEWRIPLGELGLAPADVAELRMNLGVRWKALDRWLCWVPTGGPIWHVGRAGRLRLGKP